jgi:hypothetical protein
MNKHSLDARSGRLISLNAEPALFMSASAEIADA